MSDVVWYISKYFGLPEQRVGSRPFLLLREMAGMGIRPLVFTANTNHLFTSREFSNGAEIVDMSNLLAIAYKDLSGNYQVGYYDFADYNGYYTST